MATPLFVKITKMSKLKVGPYPLFALVGFEMLLTAVIFPVLWGYGTIPNRVSNFVFFIFLTSMSVLWFLVVGFCTNNQNVQRWFSKFPASAWRILIPCIFTLYLVASVRSPNVQIAWDDLTSGRAGEFRRAWESRSDLIAEAKRLGINRVEFDRLQNVPETVFFHDLFPDPYLWPNAYYAKHMGIDAVRTKDEKPWPETPPPNNFSTPPLGK